MARAFWPETSASRGMACRPSEAFSCLPCDVSLTHAPTVSGHEALPPPPRRNSVPRPRLLAWLDEGLQHSLTLVSAPAGFGKTTLLSQWLAGGARPVAWLSLDEGESDPARFLAYLVAAIQTVAPRIGAGLETALLSPQPPPTTAILTVLLNEIATVPEPFILVLDDYHRLDSRAVDQALAFRAPAAPAAPGGRHPRKPAAPPRSPPRPGPAERAARRRLALYPRRGRRLPQYGPAP